MGSPEDWRRATYGAQRVLKLVVSNDVICEGRDSPSYCGYSFEFVPAVIRAVSRVSNYDFGLGDTIIFCGLLEWMWEELTSLVF